MRKKIGLLFSYLLPFLNTPSYCTEPAAVHHEWVTNIEMLMPVAGLDVRGRKYLQQNPTHLDNILCATVRQTITMSVMVIEYRPHFVQSQYNLLGYDSLLLTMCGVLAGSSWAVMWLLGEELFTTVCTFRRKCINIWKDMPLLDMFVRSSVITAENRCGPLCLRECFRLHIPVCRIG